MGSSANHDYFAFTKAVEHLGDRWSLFIVREFYQFGPQGVARVGADRAAPYRLAPAGERLLPTLKSLWEWAEQWVPEDPAAAQRDPTVIMWWLTHRVDPGTAPERQAVIDLAISGADHEHNWLLVARDTEPTLCLEDPLLDRDRYVYVEADAAALFPMARGQRDWTAAMADGSVHLYGDPALVSELPAWFVASEASSQPTVAVA